MDKEKDVNTINANDNLETEETGANANYTSNKGTMRKKARKDRKKDRRDKRARCEVGDESVRASASKIAKEDN